MEILINTKGDGVKKISFKGILINSNNTMGASVKIKFYGNSD